MGRVSQAPGATPGPSHCEHLTVLLTLTMAADNISTIAATLQNSSSLKGAINSENTAKEANLTLDASSTWDVTADSYLNCLSDASGISGDTVANISGNGFTVYYRQSACTELAGKTYNLNGGGYLKRLVD